MCDLPHGSAKLQIIYDLKMSKTADLDTFTIHVHVHVQVQKQLNKIEG